uniref:Uncharacterized protein n=1 Tax=Rhizophora mucronata TaxID=61149 RepID=A0A2P2NYX8_RHIMU
MKTVQESKIIAQPLLLLKCTKGTNSMKFEVFFQQHMQQIMKIL